MTFAAGLRRRLRAALVPMLVPTLVPMLASLLALAMLLSVAGAARAQGDGFVAVPPLTQRVTDLTGTLAPAQRSALENVLADYERTRGSQIFVLMVPTTDPETIDAYSIRVADAWRAGRHLCTAQLG